MRTAIWARWFLVALLALVAGPALDVSRSLADIPPGNGGRRPRPVPTPPAADEQGVESTLTLRLNPELDEPTLILPPTLVRSLALGEDDENKTSDAGSRRTMVAGIALSLSLASLVFVRRGSRATKIASAVVVVSIASVLAAVAMADIALPKRKAVPLRVVVDPEAEGVQLILNDQRIKLPQ
ncbi:MAG TPA: hypothetical protein VG713_13085 [Pirellulales bacterium]|nr:hypothetical protein [Pirellulales bacterium]